MPFYCPSCDAVTDRLEPTCETCGEFIRYVETNDRQLSRAADGDPTAALPSFGVSVSMGEGSTPLVSLDADRSAPSVYAKLDSLNPTCSFKDRGSALAVAAVADSATTWEGVIVASTGNTAPSIAAYATRADVPCAVLVPTGTSASKLSQVAAHGATIRTIDGSFSDCFEYAHRVSGERLLNGTAVYSANPFVASANRTVAFEIVAQLGYAPDWVTVPVGAGPLLGGTYYGFAELADAGIAEQVPKMLCVRARGCHPIVRAFERGEPVQPWTQEITTEVTAIADPLEGYVADGEETRRAVIKSAGDAVALDDETMFDWTDRFATRDGIYAEPASAASVAAAATDVVDPDETVVALVTGHGLKEQAEQTVDQTPVDDPAALRTDILG